VGAEQLLRHGLGLAPDRVPRLQLSLAESQLSAHLSKNG
jgi:hypothetical protein